MGRSRSRYLRPLRIGIIALLGAWLYLLMSGAGIRVGQEFAPATPEELGTAENGMVTWTPARDARLGCRYFTGLQIVEVQRGLLPGQAPGDASCPWLLDLRAR